MIKVPTSSHALRHFLIFLSLFLFFVTPTFATVSFNGSDYPDVPLEDPGKTSCALAIWVGIDGSIYANHALTGSAGYNDTCQEVLANFYSLEKVNLSGLDGVRPLFYSNPSDNLYKYSGGNWVKNYYSQNVSALNRSNPINNTTIKSTQNLVLQSSGNFSGAYGDLLTGQSAGFLAVPAYSDPTPTPTQVPATPTPTTPPPTPTSTPVPSFIVPLTSTISGTFGSTTTNNIKTILPIAGFSLATVAGILFTINKFRGIVNL